MLTACRLPTNDPSAGSCRSSAICARATLCLHISKSRSTAKHCLKTRTTRSWGCRPTSSAADSTSSSAARRDWITEESPGYLLTYLSLPPPLHHFHKIITYHQLRIIIWLMKQHCMSTFDSNDSRRQILDHFLYVHLIILIFSCSFPWYDSFLACNLIRIKTRNCRRFEVERTSVIDDS